MASSRLEKLGTIFTRTTSLMKCGAISRDDKPLWYEIYQAFPPFNEPSYARRVPLQEIKPILYPEDRIRAKFHQGIYRKTFAVENLGLETTTDTTRKVISLTNDFMKKDTNLSEDEALKKAIDKLRNENEFKQKRSKSMFKPARRKVDSVITETELVDVPQNVGDLKTISQKDVDVDSIVKKESINFEGLLNPTKKSKTNRDSVTENLGKASENISKEEIENSDSSKDK